MQSSGNGFGSRVRCTAAKLCRSDTVTNLQGAALMLEWVDLATLPGPGGPSWSATATAEDGTELRIDVWGERPEKFGQLVLLAGTNGRGPAAFQLRATGRPPSTAELVDAGSVACRKNPEWWCVAHPWRGDLEAPEACELYVIGGLMIGPVPAGQSFLMQLQVGHQLAPTPSAGVGRDA